MRSENKVALITGAAKRIGSAIALELARHGCDVAIHFQTSRREAENTLREAKKYGVRGITVRGDLGKLKDIKKIVRTTNYALGPIDILVNNAALFEKELLHRITEKEWDRHLDINAKAPFFLSQIVGLAMKKQGQGKIINLTDGSGERPYTEYIPYSASKAVLNTLTKAFAKTLAPEVQVNAVSLGSILPPSHGMKVREKMLLLKKTPLKRFGKPQDIAKTVLFLVEADYITGSVYSVDGGKSLV